LQCTSAPSPISRLSISVWPFPHAKCRCSPSTLTHCTVQPAKCPLRQAQLGASSNQSAPSIACCRFAHLPHSGLYSGGWNLNALFYRLPQSPWRGSLDYSVITLHRAMSVSVRACGRAQSMSIRAQSIRVASVAFRAAVEWMRTAIN
jgi:hypothetical protein